MGLNSFGTLGSVSGSVGPVVFCTLNDQDVVKGQPKKSNKPPVQAQIDQRDRFKLVTTLLCSSTSLIWVSSLVKRKPQE